MTRMLCPECDSHTSGFPCGICGWEPPVDYQDPDLPGSNGTCVVPDDGVIADGG